MSIINLSQSLSFLPPSLSLYSSTMLDHDAVTCSHCCFIFSSVGRRLFLLMSLSQCSFAPGHSSSLSSLYLCSLEARCLILISSFASLIFDRQWHFYGHFYCLELWGSFASRTSVWKNRRLPNFRARDSKSSLTTRCWQYDPSRGGVREMSLRTTTVLLGVRKGNLSHDAWAVEVSMYSLLHGNRRISAFRSTLKGLGFVF